MDVAAFVELVIPTVGQHCQDPDAEHCLSWSDHICADDTARCLQHCQAAGHCAPNSNDTDDSNDTDGTAAQA